MTNDEQIITLEVDPNESVCFHNFSLFFFLELNQLIMHLCVLFFFKLDCFFVNAGWKFKSFAWNWGQIFIFTILGFKL